MAKTIVFASFIVMAVLMVGTSTIPAMADWTIGTEDNRGAVPESSGSGWTIGAEENRGMITENFLEAVWTVGSFGFTGSTETTTESTETTTESTPTSGWTFGTEDNRGVVGEGSGSGWTLGAEENRGAVIENLGSGWTVGSYSFTETTTDSKITTDSETTTDSEITTDSETTIETGKLNAATGLQCVQTYFGLDCN